MPVPDGQGPHRGMYWFQRAWGQDGRRSTDPIPFCSLLAGLKVKKAKSIPPESLSPGEKGLLRWSTEPVRADFIPRCIMYRSMV